MAILAYKDIAKKNDAELQKLLTEKRQSLRDFRFSLAGSGLRDVKQGANTRKEIARIVTEMQARLQASKSWMIKQ